MSGVYYAVAMASALGFFVAMLGALEAGRRLRRWRARGGGADGGPGAVAVESAIFALLGLLIAFTFTGAASRLDVRRDLARDEANAIGTAWLRLDLLRAPDRLVLREKFRDYLQARIDTHRSFPDVAAAKALLARAAGLQQEIWSLAIAAAERDGRVYVWTLVVPALNAMFDAATSRVNAVRMHVPWVILGLLAGLALLASLLAGYGMVATSGRDWMHMITFSAVIAITLYVIVDLEFPRVGLIRIDVADEVLLDLRRSMD